MINELFGYQIEEQISATEKICVYRAKRLADDQRVIIKLLNTDYPSLHEIARLKQEYQLLKNLNISGVIKVYDFIKQDHTYAIILEEIAGAKNLKELIKEGTLDLQTTLEISIHLANALGALHQNNIIHKDISPYNILVSGQQVRIIDFSLASQLSQSEEKTEADTAEGTLSYISPEQTGRMNRIVDHRTDFYSLGVVLYEMLARELPFQADDMIGWVHAHIAKKPRAIHELRPDIPAALSDVVMKLLSKAQEERYQTAQGLKYDLEYCLNAWHRYQAIAEFPLAQQDESKVLQFPQKLYGREKEFNNLLTLFDRVAQGEQAVLLISGYSGIGKSSLVNEIQKPIVEKHALFTSGKFEQFKRDVPYSAQALNSLIKQILRGPQEQATIWRKRIIDALHPNAQIIIDVMPEIEWLIGKQPPVPELPAREAKTRFEMIFTDLVNVFANASHPLVMCLDDLQWADLATLNLLESVLLSKVTSHFLLIGTYRENEVEPGHILLEKIAALEKAGVVVSHLSLTPLSMEHIDKLIQDTLHTKADTKNLAQLVLEKTGGNPFFIHTLLTHLSQTEVLSYDGDRHAWIWDMKEIEKIPVTENMIDLLVKKIAQLPSKQKELIQIASCIGNTFDLRLLSLACNKSPIEIANELWPILQKKILIPIGEDYKLAMVDSDFARCETSILYQFAHDRIQHAVFSQLSATDKQNFSLQIGRLQLSLHDSSELTEEKLFSTVNYFSLCLNLLRNKEERLHLAQLFLKAAHKAQASIAYSAAEKYFQQAIMLLGENAWEEHYKLTFDANKGLADNLYLLRQYDALLMQCSAIKKKTTNNVDKAQVLLLETILFSTQNRYDEVIDIGIEGLNLLGMNINRHPNALKALWIIIKGSWQLHGNRVKKIVDLPLVTAPDKKLLADFLLSVFIATYFRSPKLFTLLTFSILSYSLRYGVSKSIAACLAFYGVLHIVAFRNYERGYEIGKLSLQLADKYPPDARVKMLLSILIMGLIFVHKLPYRECAKNFMDTYLSGQEIGEKELSLYAIGSVFSLRILQGEPLGHTAKELRTYSLFFQGTELQSWRDTFEVFVQTLQGTMSLNDFEHHVQQLLHQKMTSSVQKIIHVPFIFYLWAAYILEDWPFLLSLLASLKREARLGQIATTIQMREYYFYRALTFLSLYPTASAWKKVHYSHAIKSCINVIKKQAFHCPANYEAKYLVLCAGKYLIQGRLKLAIQHYEQAVASARQNELIHIEAIAHELLGRWFFESKQATSAEGYLKRAVYAYQQWGATAKVNALLAKYPSVLLSKASSLNETILIEASSQELSGVSSHSDTIKLLDLIAIMKSAQAISSHVDFKELLIDLIKVMIETSGAERGILMLMRNKQLFIEGIGNANENVPVIVHHEPIDENEDVCIPIVRYVERTRETVVLDDASQHSDYKEDPYIKKQTSLSVLCLPILHQMNLIGILYLENNLVSNAFTKKHLQISQLLASQAAISLEISQLYAAYNQFVPRQFLDLLGKRSIVDVSLGDHAQKNMCILFSDIRGFTHLSEQLTPDEIFKFMNEYLSYMEPIIIEHGGFIDKYIGDAIMALFPGQVDKALEAAIAMQRELMLKNIERAKENKTLIRMGIGINSGSLMLGTLGGAHRIDTSVLGDAVNLASRLESLTKEYDSSILISGAVYQKLTKPKQFHSRFAGLIKLPGKEQVTDVWEIYDGDPETLRFAKLAITKWYDEAIELFHKQDYKQALSLFQRCLVNLPQDKLIVKYIADCEHAL